MNTMTMGYPAQESPKLADTADMTEPAPVVYVVDDDPAIRRAVLSVIQLLGLDCELFERSNDFLRRYQPGSPGCLVLDLRTDGMSGLELMQRLKDMQGEIPVIVISGHADVRIAVEVMSLGAVTLLEKPFHLHELSEHILKALELDRKLRHDSEARRRLQRLTVKEREVFDLITEGMTNKQIAATLKLSVRAVEDRRARLMRKLEVTSAAELGKLA